MSKYFKQEFEEEEEEEEMEFRILLFRYVYYFYFFYNILFIGWIYKEFFFVVFCSYSLVEM